MTNSISKPKQRIAALDILRGITIAMMILVNNPGTWEHVYTPLDHAEWIGLTPTDMVFPFFMFIMGITTFISLRKYGFRPSKAAFAKIAYRTIGIILICYLICMFSHFCNFMTYADPKYSLQFRLSEGFLSCFTTLRFTGVLVRLAVCYCIVAVLALLVKHSRFPWIIAGLFIIYYIILELGNGYAHDETNILSIVDRTIVTLPHMWNDNNIDPEGILSTIPSIGHMMIGFLVGRMLLGGDNQPEDRTARLWQGITRLLFVGAALIIAGFLLSYACPIAKKIWTPTFSMVTCGFAASSLALLIYIVDIKGKKKWAGFFMAFGVNPLFLYIMSDVLSILIGCIKTPWGPLHWMAYDKLSHVFGPNGGSLGFALLFVLLCYIAVAYPLYKRKIYIKL